jgi:hypothetical protein
LSLLEPLMEVRYNLDADTGQPHICHHGVREHEVEEVLARPGEDRSGSEGARVVIGQTHAGRYLRVVYAPDPEGDGLFVITAYALRGRPLAAYKRRLRRKRGR